MGPGCPAGQPPPPRCPGPWPWCCNAPSPGSLGGASTATQSVRRPALLGEGQTVGPLGGDLWAQAPPLSAALPRAGRGRAGVGARWGGGTSKEELQLEGCWAVRRREDLPARWAEQVGEDARPLWVGWRCQEGLGSGVYGALAMGEDGAARALFWVRRVMSRLVAGQ